MTFSIKDISIYSLLHSKNPSIPTKYLGLWHDINKGLYYFDKFPILRCTIYEKVFRKGMKKGNQGAQMTLGVGG